MILIIYIYTKVISKFIKNTKLINKTCKNIKFFILKPIIFLVMQIHLIQIQ